MSLVKSRKSTALSVTGDGEAQYMSSVNCDLACSDN